LSLKENAKNYLKILQALPDKQKKIILWATVAVLAIIMGYFWIKSVAVKIESINFKL